jgi:hypothetical protein
MLATGGQIEGRTSTDGVSWAGGRLDASADSSTTGAITTASAVASVATRALRGINPPHHAPPMAPTTMAAASDAWIDSFRMAGLLAAAAAEGSPSSGNSHSGCFGCPDSNDVAAIASSVTNDARALTTSSSD